MIPLYTLSIEKKVFCEFTKRLTQRAAHLLLQHLQKSHGSVFFRISTNISRTCYSRLAQDRLLRSKERFDIVKRSKDPTSLPLMFFPPSPISHIYAVRPIFPSTFADLLEPHTSPSCLSLVYMHFATWRHLKQTTRINE